MSPNPVSLWNGGYVSASRAPASDIVSVVSSSASSLNSTVSTDLSESSSIAATSDSDHDLVDCDGHPCPSVFVVQPHRPTSEAACPPTESACSALGSIGKQLQFHPRRRQSGAQRPPKLARSDERKTEFVNDLVDSATSMVEIIWPRWDAGRCKRSSSQGPLTMRLYIEETLRRSRTSYSTLQVALYYLILFKYNMPPAGDIISTNTALQCGRRMFLAALILASKYLQDRNYSAKAWSKMCGLTTAEINDNERRFLWIVDWKLHIPDRVFKRWTDVVLRFTTAQLRAGTPLASQMLWRQVIPFLTPDLDDPRLPVSGIEDTGCPTPETGPSSPSGSFASEKRVLTPAPVANLSTAQEFAMPFPNITPAHSPETPGLRRAGLLPTPSLTPSTAIAGTPAVSAGSHSDQYRQISFPEAALVCLSHRGSSATSVSSLVSSPVSMSVDTASRASPHFSMPMVAASRWFCTAAPAMDIPTGEPMPLRRSGRHQGTAQQPICIDEIDAPKLHGLAYQTQPFLADRDFSNSVKNRKRARSVGILDQTGDVVIDDDNDDEVVALHGDSCRSPTPCDSSALSVAAARPNASRKRHCPSRPLRLDQGVSLPETPPESTSPELCARSVGRGGPASPCTPPESTPSSPDLLMQTGPYMWSMMAE